MLGLLLELPRRIAVRKLNRPFESRHDHLQFTWKAKGPPQMLFDSTLGDDTLVRNENAQVSATVHHQYILVQVFDRRDNGIGYGSRLQHRADTLMGTVVLFAHAIFSQDKNV